MDSLINTTQLLLYKENISFLEKLNLEDDKTFLEPLLFAYFNSKQYETVSKELLEELMQGYFTENESLKIEHSFGKQELVYLPKLGFFNKSKEKIQECYIIRNTKIELLYRPFDLLNAIFEYSSRINTLNKIEMNDFLFEKFIHKIEKAFKLIKENCLEHFRLIEKYCQRIVLFKTNPKVINSFETINAYGMAFLNVYQDDYDEVFFIDDIAHQTGHIIMTTILFERKKYFLINEEENIGRITNSRFEHRNLNTLFHALYTYYTTFLCLDNCLENNSFSTKQIYETKGRIGFYLMKCNFDLLNFEKIIDYHKGIHNVLSQECIEIFRSIETKYFEILKKYEKEVSKYDYGNQPYNFTYKNFLELNPLNNA